jgi:hypothetical protein
MSVANVFRYFQSNEQKYFNWLKELVTNRNKSFPFRKNADSIGQRMGKGIYKNWLRHIDSVCPNFSQALGGAPALLLSLADPLSLAHSENESVSIDGWRKPVRSLIDFMANI